MSNTISEMLADLARLADLSNEGFLAYLCRMASMEANGKTLFSAAKHDVVGLWDWDVARDRVRFNPGASVLLGIDPVRARYGLPAEAYRKVVQVHPDDAALVTATIGRTLINGGDYELSYRVKVAGHVRKVTAKGYCTLDAFSNPERFPGAIIQAAA